MILVSTSSTRISCVWGYSILDWQGGWSGFTM